MKFIEAKQEFEIRYYLWSISESEKEINEGFPNLRLFKHGACWELHQFMQQLDRGEQLMLSHGRLKFIHSKILPVLGESISTDENILLNRFFKFGSQFNGVRVPQLGTNGEKIKFASKSKIKKIIASKFLNAFESRCIKIPTGEYPDLRYEMKFSGWIVYTFFTFSGRARVLDYVHGIESEETIPNPPFPPELWMSAMRLQEGISFGRWLGLGGTSWECLLPEEVEPACDMIIKFCRQFYGVLPKLLKGLEFDKIDKDKPAELNSTRQP
jgi:hypothetical protein